MTPNLSREQRIYLAIWRKAYRERNNPEPVTLNVSNLSVGISIQSAMYRTIRPYRTGKAFDAELQASAENFVVQLPKLEDPTAPHVIYLRHRMTLTELEAALADLGIDEEDLLTSEEVKINQSLDKLIFRDDKPPAIASPERPANPFFTRED